MFRPVIRRTSSHVPNSSWVNQKSRAAPRFGGVRLRIDALEVGKVALQKNDDRLPGRGAGQKRLLPTPFRPPFFEKGLKAQFLADTADRRQVPDVNFAVLVA